MNELNKINKNYETVNYELTTTKGELEEETTKVDLLKKQF